MAGKRKHPVTHRQYAAEHGVSLPTAKRRTKAGLSIAGGDVGAAILSEDADRNPAAFKELSVDEAKRRRQVVGWLREELNLSIAQKNHLPVEQVREDCIRIGAVVNGELAALLDDMPGALAGLSELQVRDKLASRISALKDSIKRELQNVAGK
jgi:hypothetical protein